MFTIFGKLQGNILRYVFAGCSRVYNGNRCSSGWEYESGYVMGYMTNKPIMGYRSDTMAI